MNIRTSLQSAKLPKLLADLQHANQFLKVFSLLALTSALVSLVAVFVMVSKGPIVIALAANAQPVTLETQPNLEREVEVALRKYISLRYSWDSKTIPERLAQSKAFVLQSTLRSFDANLAEVVKFAADRSVTQRGYVSEIIVEGAQRRAKIRGDRVSTIQGLTAAGPLNLVLEFEYGARTKENPWGIYVSKERNE